MKTSAILLAFAGAVSAASAPCDFGVLANTLAPAIVASPFYASCKADSGYDILLLSSGVVPTEDETKKLVASTNCAALYKNLQEGVAKVTPLCSIGGVDTTAFSALSITEGLAAVQKAVASLSTTGTTTTGTTTTGTNSTSGNSTTSNNVVAATTVPASTTAAAAKSSAASTGVAIAAVAFTAVAALH